MKNASLEIMKQIKLNGMSSCYENLLTLPVDQQPDGHEMVAQLVDAERQHREYRRTETYLRLSKMRYKVTLPDIRCSEKRNLSKQTIMQLADCAWVPQGAENIMITGATGCGKSYLSCALGHQACQLGLRTLYYNMNRFCEQITLAKTDGTLIKWLNRIQKAKLVIIDDFGLQPLTHQVKLLLLQILEDRYGQASVIISSQLPISKWYEYLDEPTLADAILDRIIPKAHRIELKGKSMRTAIG